MRPRPVLLLPLLLALLLALRGARAAAADGPQRLPVPEDLRREGTEHWYGIYMAGAKVGWALRQLGPLEKDGERFLRSRQVTFMRTAGRGEVTTTRIERRRIYDAQPPYTLRRASSVTRRGGFTREVEVRRDGAALWAVLREARENERRVRVAGAPPTFADETTPAAWFRAGPAVGATLTYRSLDLGRLRVEPATLTVTSVDGSPRAYAADLRSAAGDTDHVRHDARGAMLSTRMMGLLEVRREPQDQAQALGAPVNPLQATEARLDKPLGEEDLVRRLVLRVRGPDAARIPAGPAQQVRAEPGGASAVLTIDPEHGPAVPAGAEAQRRALEETPQYPVRNPVVRALAEETVARVHGERARVEALLHFVSDFVVDTHTLSPLTALDVLARQRGDCNEHALLFTALARAAGIPAREVYGLIYKNDRDRSFGRHAWCEVVIDGVWVPVDPFLDEMRISAAHLRLGARDEGPDLRLALAGGRFELLGLRRDDPPPGLASDH